MTPAQIRHCLNVEWIDIETGRTDRDTGAGIVMAFQRAGQWRNGTGSTRSGNPNLHRDGGDGDVSRNRVSVSVSPFR